MKYPNIEAERVRSGLSRDDFSKAAGINKRVYENIQYGNTRMQLDVAARFAKLTGKSIEYLIQEGRNHAESKPGENAGAVSG